MDDLISRQTVIDAVLELDASHRVSWTDAVIDTIDALPPAEPGWIPVSKELPEDYRDVLVWFEYFRYGDYNRMFSTYGIGNYSNQYDSWLINHETGWTDLHVFAWMPMPEPPKMEGDQE